jgi:hypothetical protein
MQSQIKRVDELPLIMTVKDVVKFLGISTTNAYALFNRADFPTIRINRRKLVSRDNLFKWLELQTNITFDNTEAM